MFSVLSACSKEGFFMITFDYDFLTTAVPREVRMYLSLINGHKNRQTVYEMNSYILEKMARSAKLQSVAATNRNLCISISDMRIRDLVEDSTEPHSTEEKEILGYRSCLDKIQENQEKSPFSHETILRMYNCIFQRSPVIYPDKLRVLENLCAAYNRARENRAASLLILNIQFVRDFICMKPFDSGNGRVSRILLNFLLKRDGYFIGTYISLESLIEKTKDCYSDMLRSCSSTWQKSADDSWGFVRYMLGIILSAYREIENKAEYIPGTRRQFSGY